MSESNTLTDPGIYVHISYPDGPFLTRRFMSMEDADKYIDEIREDVQINHELGGATRIKVEIQTGRDVEEVDVSPRDAENLEEGSNV